MNANSIKTNGFQKSKMAQKKWNPATGLKGFARVFVIAIIAVSLPIYLSAEPNLSQNNPMFLGEGVTDNLDQSAMDSEMQDVVMENTVMDETSTAVNAWEVDGPRSLVQFYVDASMENVTGTFANYSLSEFNYVPGAVESLSGSVLVDISSVSTGKSMRDDHLMESDFFDVEHHPYAVVAVNEVYEEMDEYMANVSIIIKGNEESYDIPVEIQTEGNSIVASGKFLVDRRDFELNGNILSNSIVSDEVLLRFRLALRKATI